MTPARTRTSLTRESRRRRRDASLSHPRGTTAQHRIRRRSGPTAGATTLRISVGDQNDPPGWLLDDRGLQAQPLVALLAAYWADRLFDGALATVRPPKPGPRGRPAEYTIGSGIGAGGEASAGALLPAAGVQVGPGPGGCLLAPRSQKHLRGSGKAPSPVGLLARCRPSRSKATITALRCPWRICSVAPARCLLTRRW